VKLDGDDSLLPSRLVYIRIETLKTALSPNVFYPEINWHVTGVFTEGYAGLPRGLATRVASAYPAALGQFAGYSASMWATIDARKRDIHAALIGASADSEAVERILSDPGATELFWGVDPTFPEFTEQIRASPGGTAQLICDRVLRLAEAVGALRIWHYADGARTVAVDIPETLAAIEQRIGGVLDFPNPFPREFGVMTPRGAVTERALQATFQAWRVQQLAERYGGKTLEIGAGLGRTAYHARALGITDYTIVDLPMGLVIQAAFLGRVLGGEGLAFPNEVARPDQIRILTPTTLLSSDEQFDIVINADSMTEMDREHAEAYAAFIATHAKVFISINHDANSFRVSDLAALRGVATLRAPHWMNVGYTEEFFFFWPTL